ncbi:MAG: dihydroorotate dehydrogenase electron transfer subunit, partial [Oscillospiraceae bacterium]
MKRELFTIQGNDKLTENVFKLTLCGDTAAITASGQFVNIELEGLYLRRPISVCDLNGDSLALIYKVVGKGTELMSAMNKGETLNVLVGLGNGYDTSKSGSAPVLIGGGVGVPPLYLLAKTLIGEGKRPRVILGFNTAKEIFLEEEFLALGIEVLVTT